MGFFGKKDKHGKKTVSKPASQAQHVSSRESFEFVKRRVVVPLAILERPLMSDTEFVVDARYSSVKLLGSGSYGIVCSAYDSITASRVAIKKILNPFANKHQTRHCLRELRLLRHLKHPCIVELLDIDVPRQYKAWESVYLVTPLLNIDLKTALRSGKLEDKTLQKRVAYQMLLALQHMHEGGVMHRDIKSGNLLLDKELNVKICDLGESRFHSKANRDEVPGDMEQPSLEPELSVNVSTMIQSAPEISLGGEYDAEVDIWAAGCVIAEIIHPQHEFLFDNTSKSAHVQEIISVVGCSEDEMNDLPEHSGWYLRKMVRNEDLHEGTRIKEKLGSGVDAVAVDLLEKMLRFSPKRRLSAKLALQHKWFDEVRDNCQYSKATYNFALSEPPKKLSKAELKNLVWEEVVAFHPEAEFLPGVR